MIRENIEDIKRRIKAAAIKSGRNFKDITLMAVSKTMPLEKAIEAASCEGVVLGENYVQEFRDKFDLSPELPWHFIGHLQKNKVKYVVPRAKMIHSVDSVALAEKINEESAKKGLISQCLLEINAGCEDSKFGLTIEETPYIIKEILNFKNISVRGLMTVAPYVSNPEENREIFKEMYKLFKTCQKISPEIDTLSMGMSGDFEVAVEEGSNLVRVGTSIFGERNYTK